MSTHVELMPTAPPPRRAESPWLRRLLVFLTCVVLIESMFGNRGVAERIKAGREYQRAELSLRTARLENARMLDEIQRLRSDPAAIEALAREELGLIRPGEVLFLVENP